MVTAGGRAWMALDYQQLALQLDLLVRPVAEGRSLRVLALAPRDSLGLGYLNHEGSEFASFVGPIAEGLGRGLTTSAPIIRPFFGGLNRGESLSNNWNLHRHIVYYTKPGKQLCDAWLRQRLPSIRAAPRRQR